MIFGFFRKKAKDAEPQGTLVGTITHYFGHCKAGVIKLTDTLSVGDTIHIKGHTTDLKQKIHSMQIDGKEVPTATNGKEVGILVKKRLRQHDKVYKL